MKLVVLFAAGILSLLSMALINKKTINGHAERMAIAALPSRDLQAKAFNEKPADVKAAIWADKLDVTLAAGWMNTAQAQQIQQLRNQIAPALWLEGNDIREVFITQFHNQWVAASLQVFEKNLLASIVNTMGDVNPAGPVVSPSSDECECSATSDWCSFDMYCKKDCYAWGMFGCGSMWAFRCNGRCHLQ